MGPWWRTWLAPSVTHFLSCLPSSEHLFFLVCFSSSKVKVGTNCRFGCGHSQVERYHLFPFVVTGAETSVQLFRGYAMPAAVRPGVLSEAFAILLHQKTLHNTV